MPVRNRRLQESIVFTQSVTQTKVTLTVATSDNIVFVGVADYFYGRGITLSSLALTQIVEVNLKERDANNNLTFTQLVDQSNVLFKDTIVDTLNLTQNILLIKPTSFTLTDTLNFTHDARNSIHFVNATNTLNLIQPVNLLGPVNVSAVTLVDLGHSISTVNILNIIVASSISLDQSGVKTLELVANNLIHLSHLAESALHEDSVNVVQLLHSVSVHNTQPAVNTLDLLHIIDVDGIFVDSLTDNLNLGSIVTFYRIGDLCIYDPGVGAGPDAPSMVDPILTRRSTILLTFPYINPLITIEVRAPQFDDTEQYEFRRINRKTRGGTLTIFRDNTWPTSERLIYSFDNLKEQKKKDILEFLQNSIGKEVGLLDYESRQWRGIVLTPTTQIGNEDRPGNSVTIEFEGVIDPGGLGVTIVANASINADATDIPPGFQSGLTASGQLVGDIIRD